MTGRSVDRTVCLLVGRLVDRSVDRLVGRLVVHAQSGGGLFGRLCGRPSAAGASGPGIEAAWLLLYIAHSKTCRIFTSSAHLACTKRLLVAMTFVVVHDPAGDPSPDTSSN